MSKFTNLMQVTRSPAAAQDCQDPSLDPREVAHHLLELGLPITICQPTTKAPIGKGWPNKTWTHDQVDNEFKASGDLNVGLILGPRSGLIDIEIDGPDGDAALLELFDGDVPVTPMWHSARGPHRLFQWHDDLGQVGKSSITMGPLEIRLGANGKGAQSLLPPSITDGWDRRWVVPLEECLPAPLPTSVLARIIAGFGGRCGHDCASAEVAAETEVVHSIAVYHAVSHSQPHRHNNENGHGTNHNRAVQTAINRAIDNTLPGSEGFRNKLLLQFARQLKGIPQLATTQPELLLPHVQEWHRQALPSIGTQDFEVTWDDFLVAWGNVKYLAGDGPLDEIYAAGLLNMPAVATNYKGTGVRNLVALCRELQLRAGDQPFWLACRPAAAVLKTSPPSANRWLWKLMYGKVIERITEGSRGKAAEYRYLGD